MLDDLELLGAYVANGSEEAFRTVVERYLGLVYSSALRQVRDPQLAEDVTQAVFLILARKAGSLRPGTVVAGWLFRTTGFASRSALRAAQRRQHWEQKAAEMQPTTTDSLHEATWNDIAPILDEAVSDLGQTDRHAILLRFFERKEFKEVGQAIGTSEEAAKKRVTRALEKMRVFFARRGVVLSASFLAGAVMANGVQAGPPALCAAIPASLAGSIPMTTTLLALVNQTMKTILLTKVKTAAVLISTLIGMGGVGGLVVAAIAKAPTDSFVLSDGTRATLRGVTVGTNASFRFGSLFDRMGARVPGKTGAGFAAAISAHTEPGDQENVVFWFSYDRPSTNQHWIDVHFIQDDLEQFLESWHVPPKTLPNGQMITFCGHKIWPRRAKTFRLQVSEAFQGGARRPLGECRIANPVSRPYPVWTPEPLPLTRRVGEVEFRLEQLDFARGLAELKGRRPGGWPASVGVRLSITRDGQPNPDWDVWSYQVKDATGNLYPARRAVWYRPLERAAADQAGKLDFPIRGYVWPGEKAFKLGLELVCARGWASDETFVVRRVPVQPDPNGYYRKWGADTARGLISFWLGPDAEDPQHRHCLTEREPDNLELGPDTGGVPRLLILGAVDEQGRTLEPFQQRKLYIPADAKRLDVTLVAPRREYIEYTVAP